MCRGRSAGCPPRSRAYRRSRREASCGSSPVRARRAARAGLRLQLLLQLVEPFEVARIGDDLLWRLSDELSAGEPLSEEAERVLGIELAPIQVGVLVDVVDHLLGEGGRVL